MSFWDHIKPSQPAPTPTRLELSEDRRLLLADWSDGAQTRVRAQILRGLCPCAVCVDEWTNQRRHDPGKVPAGTTVEGLQRMGHYAVQLAFSDRHATGIFTWATLRQLSEKYPG
jgi:DUF971 family protein